MSEPVPERRDERQDVHQVRHLDISKYKYKHFIECRVGWIPTPILISTLIKTDSKSFIYTG